MIKKLLFQISFALFTFVLIVTLSLLGFDALMASLDNRSLADTLTTLFS
ncbi:MAG: hypothetical protein M0Z65_15920 [Firmicutes bacterium]|nr:hypothetical protein [Bacillota bacterium]